jgi:hypothetical protein
VVCIHLLARKKVWKMVLSMAAVVADAVALYLDYDLKVLLGAVSGDCCADCTPSSMVSGVLYGPGVGSGDGDGGG